MADKTNSDEQADDRQETLLRSVEAALSGGQLGVLQSAEAQYAAAVTATIAPVSVTTTTTT